MAEHRKAGDIRQRLDRLEAKHPPRQADGIAWAAASDEDVRAIAWCDPEAPSAEALRAIRRVPRFDG